VGIGSVVMAVVLWVFVGMTLGGAA